MAALALCAAALLPLLADARAVAGPRLHLAPFPVGLPKATAPLASAPAPAVGASPATLSASLLGTAVATGVTVAFPSAPLGTGVAPGVFWPPLAAGTGVPPLPGTGGVAGTAPPYPLGTGVPPLPGTALGTAAPYPLGTAVPPLPGTGLSGTAAAAPYPTAAAAPDAPPYALGTAVPKAPGAPPLATGAAPYPTPAAAAAAPPAPAVDSGYLPYAAPNTAALPPLGTGALTASPPLGTGALPPPLCLVGAIRCDGFHAWSVCTAGAAGPAYQSVGAVPSGLECADGQLMKQKGRDCAGEDGQIVCGPDGALKGVCEAGGLVAVPANATGAGVGCISGTLVPV